MKTLCLDQVATLKELSRPQLVDASTLAARLAVPESHVRSMQRSGQIPCVRVGAKYIRFNVAEVLKARRK